MISIKRENTLSEVLLTSSFTTISPTIYAASHAVSSPKASANFTDYMSSSISAVQNLHPDRYVCLDIIYLLNYIYIYIYILKESKRNIYISYASSTCKIFIPFWKHGVWHTSWISKHCVFLKIIVSSLSLMSRLARELLVIFLLKFLLNSFSKSSFFALAPRSGFGAAISDAIKRGSIMFYCVLQRNLCRSHCKFKLAWCKGLALCKTCVKAGFVWKLLCVKPCSV